MTLYYCGEQTSFVYKTDSSLSRGPYLEVGFMTQDNGTTIFCELRNRDEGTVHTFEVTHAFNRILALRAQARDTQ